MYEGQIKGGFYMLKKFLSLRLYALLLLILLVPVISMAASEGEITSEKEGEVSIQYVYINEASTSLSISSDGTFYIPIQFLCSHL